MDVSDTYTACKYLPLPACHHTHKHAAVAHCAMHCLPGKPAFLCAFLPATAHAACPHTHHCTFCLCLPPLQFLPCHCPLLSLCLVWPCLPTLAACLTCHACPTLQLSNTLPSSLSLSGVGDGGRDGGDGRKNKPCGLEGQPSFVFVPVSSPCLCVCLPACLLPFYHIIYLPFSSGGGGRHSSVPWTPVCSPAFFPLPSRD